MDIEKEYEYRSKIDSLRSERMYCMIDTEALKKLKKPSTIICAIGVSILFFIIFYIALFLAALLISILGVLLFGMSMDGSVGLVFSTVILKALTLGDNAGIFWIMVAAYVGAYKLSSVTANCIAKKGSPLHCWTYLFSGSLLCAYGIFGIIMSFSNAFSWRAGIFIIICGFVALFHSRDAFYDYKKDAGVSMFRHE